MKIWSVATSKCVATVAVDVRRLQFSLSGRWLCALSGVGELLVAEASTGRVLFTYLSFDGLCFAVNIIASRWEGRWRPEKARRAPGCFGGWVIPAPSLFDGLLITGGNGPLAAEKARRAPSGLAPLGNTSAFGCAAQRHRRQSTCIASSDAKTNGQT